MAMSDGAAFCLRNSILNNHPKKALLAHIYEKLTSSDPSEAWTSGQWMTERDGGSDVNNGTKTVADCQNDPFLYRLYGLKWFTSATESEVAITLARILDPVSKQPAKELTAFLVVLHEPGT